MRDDAKRSVDEQVRILVAAALLDEDVSLAQPQLACVGAKPFTRLGFEQQERPVAQGARQRSSRCETSGTDGSQPSFTRER
ncbi:MAG TPA: hypothetical protein VFV20_01720, partial [Candidatus Limnocylindria bacterium]|nr:hypothetical protein [Candidatus Limnocylindria bacterium]